MQINQNQMPHLQYIGVHEHQYTEGVAFTCMSHQTCSHQPILVQFLPSKIQARNSLPHSLYTSWHLVKISSSETEGTLLPHHQPHRNTTDANSYPQPHPHLHLYPHLHPHPHLHHHFHWCLLYGSPHTFGDEMWRAQRCLHDEASGLHSNALWRDAGNHHHSHLPMPLTMTNIPNTIRTSDYNYASMFQSTCSLLQTMTHKMYHWLIR